MSGGKASGKGRKAAARRPQMTPIATAAPTPPATMNTGISILISTQLPARNRMNFGGPSGYQ